MTVTVERPVGGTRRTATLRTYLMCPPTFFSVTYEINPWMDASTPVDVGRAMAQWSALRATYQRLGHDIRILEPEPGLPDMVYAANGAFSVHGKVFGARFAYPQRAAEAAAHRQWYAANGRPTVPGDHVNEGEGDFTFVPGRSRYRDQGLILAGHGFRTRRSAHLEAARVLDHPVVSLRLVDSRFYHLDTALFVLDAGTIAYFPGAFSARSRRTLTDLFPTAVLATESDALAFGLNAVSDGRHVILPSGARNLATALQDRGFQPILVDMSELHRGGGSVKCCTAELRFAQH